MRKKTLKDELDKLGLNQEREDPCEDVLRAHQKAVISAKSDLPDAEERERSATHSVTVKLPDIAAHAATEKSRRGGHNKAGHEGIFMQVVRRIVEGTDARTAEEILKQFRNGTVEDLCASLCLGPLDFSFIEVDENNTIHYRSKGREKTATFGHLKNTLRAILNP